MDSAIARALEDAGLTPKEALAYTALLELGQGGVSEIAAQANLKRSNVYSILEKLQEKGFVTPIPGTRVQHYAPADPVRILHSLQESTTILRDMLPLIRALYNK